jgi:hypothetical protein
LQRIQIAGEIRREAHQQQHFLGVDGWLDLLRAFQQQHVGKGFGTGEALGQLYGVFTVVFVINGDRGVGDLQGGGKGKQQHLDQYR